MHSKKLYENKKKELLDIIEDTTINSTQKLDKLNLLELFTNLEIYQTELFAQNQELADQEKQTLISRDEFEELYNFAPIAYLKLDANFKILKYNRIAFNLLAKENRSLKITNQLNIFIHKDSMKEYINFISKTKSLGKNEGTLQFLIDKDIMYGRVNIASYEKNQRTYYLLSIIDITNEVTQEALLLHQAKQSAMGEMLSMITHQWKQPLSILSTVSSTMGVYLDLEKFDKEKFSNFLQNIEDQVQYMSETIDDFKSFFDESKKKEKINIKECINRAIKFTAPALKKYSIELTINADSDKYYILAYKHDVCQILMNIINNAKDELKKKDIKRKINLNISLDNTHVILAIKNNGGIIPTKQINRIFNKHYSTKLNNSGSGLGLYISKKIADEHLQADLSVKNIEDEDSVVFYLSVPMIEERE